MSATRSDFVQGMQKDSYKYFLEEYDLHPQVAEQILREERSTASHEKGTVVVGMDLLAEKTSELQDAPVVDPGEAQTTIGKNRTFHQRLTISEEAQADQQKLDNLVRKMAQDWGRQIPRTRETFFAKAFNKGGLTAGHDVFNNGITTVVSDSQGDLIYDGLPLFNLSGNTRASQVGAATYYNGEALSLTHDNLETVTQLMENTNNRDERDNIIMLKANTLLVPRALKENAKRILNSDKRPGTANNDTNVHNGELDLVVWHYLDDADAWFVGERMSPSIIRQERQEPTIRFYDDMDNGSLNARITSRWGLRVDNWRHWVGSNFSTS